MDDKGQTGQAALMVTICSASGSVCRGPSDCCSPLTCQLDPTGTGMGSCH